MREEFTERTWGHWPDGARCLRTLVVNPLGNWWSYAFSIEAALRLRDEGHEVFFLDLAPSESANLEVNRRDRRSRWRFRQPQARIARLLKERGVRWVSIPFDNLGGDADWFPSSLNDLRHWRVDERPSGRILAAAISGVLRERDFVPSDHRRIVEDHIAAYKFGSSVLQHQIRELLPDLIVTTNDRLLNAAIAVAEARQHGIESLVIYWGDTERKCVTYQHSLYDPDDWRSHIAGAWSEVNGSKRNLNVAWTALHAAGEDGLPATAEFRSAMGLEELPKLPPKKKILAFFPTTPWEYSGLVNRPEGYFQDQVAAVRSMLEVVNPNEWSVVIRHHPPRKGQQPLAEPASWAGVREHVAVFEIPADSGVDSYELIDASDLVAVWVSTIGLEAISRGKPVMVMGEPYWLDHEWGISAPTKKHVALLVDRPKVIEPDLLLPYLCYFEAYGSPLRHVTGVGSDHLRVHGQRVFGRTLPGVVFTWLKRLRLFGAAGVNSCT